jgi:putative ABC transport system ATP-binding protein
MTVHKWERDRAVTLAHELLDKVGIPEKADAYPEQLSGGQQQRVAIARALVNQPSLILADEPTGNLDTKSGDEIMELLLKLNREYGTTLVFVTHDPDIAAQTNRVIRLLDGEITEDIRN